MRNFNLKPTKGVWELTLACNMQCRHCGSSAGVSLKDELSTKEALKLADDLADLGLQAITLSGGEPFLRSDWHLIGKQLTSNGIATNIITNGWSITEETLDKMISANINNILLSIDGLIDTHDWLRKSGSYEKNLALLTLLKKHNIPAACITTLNRKNIVDLPLLKKVLIEHDVKGWQLQLAMPMGNLKLYPELVLQAADLPKIILFAQEVYHENKIAIYLGDNIGYNSSLGEELIRQGKAHSTTQQINLNFCWQGCHAAKRVIGICANGDITGCLTLRGKDYVAGNILKQTLSDIWFNSEVLKKLRNLNQNELSGFCQNCAHGATCLGGCTAQKVTFKGSMYAENPTCLYHWQCDNLPQN